MLIAIDANHRLRTSHHFTSVTEKTTDVSQSNKPFRLFAQTAPLIFAYYFVLLSHLPFELATLVFLAVAQYLFGPADHIKRNLLVSFFLTVLITLAFRLFFGVLLPGSFDSIGYVMHWLSDIR